MDSSERNASKWFFRGIVFSELSGIAMVLGALIPGALDSSVALLFGSWSGDLVRLDVPGRLACGIAGSVLTGWATSMGLALRRSKDQRREDRRSEEFSVSAIASAFATGVFTWFVLDSIVSLALGAHYNLISNTLYLALLCIPLWHLSRRGRSATRLEPNVELTRSS